MTIFDWLEQQDKESKRLVKSDLKTLDYNILNYLKKHALGSNNKVTGRELMVRFGLNDTSQVRKAINSLRNDPSNHIMIGSDSGGYYIPTKDEEEQAIRYKLSRTIGEIETMLNLYPRAAGILHRVIGYIDKGTDKVAQGQYQMQFNGWEQETINHYADKYMKENENDSW